MSISILNLRTFGIGSKPESLEPGQICFNLTERRIFVGDGSDYLTSFDGTSTLGVPGSGWYEMPMGNTGLSEFYLQNPASLGDFPSNGQVLSWNTILNHPVWTTITPGGPTSGAVYQTTNAAVAAAPGTTITDKINAALQISPTTVCAAIVEGVPGDQYQGLYYFVNGFWVFAANYADPTATEVFYSGINSGIAASNVQDAIDSVNNKATEAIIDASTAVETANAAQNTASIAEASATLAQNTANAAATAASAAQVTADSAAAVAAVAQSTATAAGAAAATAQNTANSAAVTATTALNIAQQAIPESILTAKGQLIVGTGANTYIALSSGSNGQILVVDSTQPSGLKWASSAPGTVSSVSGINPIVVNNTDPTNPVISVNAASLLAAGVVQLNNTTSSTSTTLAATANAVKTTYDVAAAALPKAGGTLTGDLYSTPLQTPGIAAATDLGLAADPSTGLIKSLTAFDGGLY